MVMITVSTPVGVQGEKGPVMTAFGRRIEYTNWVRNELNMARAMNEIVYSENADGSQGVPYMPRTFPLGTWKVGRPVQKVGLMAPYFIPTDAHQLVDEWEVQNGLYVGKTGRQVMDWGYGLHCLLTVHHLESWGCFVIEDLEDLDFLVNQVINFLADPVYGGVLEIAVS